MEDSAVFTADNLAASVGDWVVSQSGLRQFLGKFILQGGVYSRFGVL